MGDVRTLFEAAGGTQDDVDAQHWRASVTSALFGVPADPVRVERYTILERLGSGGAGTVFAAWDPKLDRRVALKLLHATSSDETQGALQREAKLLAQLNHPNVVAVYDVSSHEGRPLLAMEFVDGPTVEKWSAEPHRHWSEVVEAFAQAARGLAAAHAAGIVHGDFKPSNALVGTADPTARDTVGRVRVSDFGIARLHGDRDTPVSGTPRYTAPELLRGGVPDSRSDIFAFFASLFECLSGRPAFSGSTRRAITANILRGRHAPLPAGTLPRWLVSVVLEGLRPNPDRRPSDLVRIADRLERRGTSSRRWGWAFAAAAAGLAATPLLIGSDARADNCGDALADAQAAWTPSSKDSVAERWRQSGRAGAEESWSRVSAELDAYVAEFAAATETVCQTAAQPEVRLQAQLCLRWRQQDLEAMLTALADADAEGIEMAPLALQNLSSPRSCTPDEADPSSPRPESPAVRRQVQQRVSQARALRGLGRSDEARQHLDEALSLAQTTEAPRLQAEVLLELGRERARRLGITDDGPTAMTLEAARQAAWVVGDRQLAARACLELAEAYLRSAQFERARSWLDRAQAEMTAFRDPIDRGRVELLRGLMLSFEGDNDAALARSEAAVTLLEQSPGGGPWLGRALNSFGEFRYERGEYAEAQELYERGLEVWSDALGPSHAYVADIHGNLGETLLLQGDFGGARRNFARALAIRKAVLDDNAFMVVHTRAHLGDALRLGGRLDEATAAYEATLGSAAELRAQLDRGLQGRQAFLDLDLGLDHVEPWARNGLALIALQRGDAEAALRHAEAAPVVDLKPDRHSDLASRRDVLGLALAANGRLEEARAVLEEAEAPLLERFGPDCVKSWFVPVALAQVLDQLGEHDAAAAARERARAVADLDSAAAFQQPRPQR